MRIGRGVTGAKRRSVTGAKLRMRRIRVGFGKDPGEGSAQVAPAARPGESRARRSPRRAAPRRPRLVPGRLEDPMLSLLSNTWALLFGMLLLMMILRGGWLVGSGPQPG